MLRTAVEVLIPGRPPHEVRELARARSGKWGREGLIFRVEDGDRVWAWVGGRLAWAMLGTSGFGQTAPVLRGQLVADAKGTRVVGKLSWSPYIGGIFVTAGAAFGFLIAGIWMLLGGDPTTGVVVLLFAPFFGWLSSMQARSFGTTKTYEADRLSDEIRSMFKKGR